MTMNGRQIWSIDRAPDPHPIFLRVDPAPVTSVGFWIYLRIGVTTTGYHDDDESQRAITVFPPHRADWFAARAMPADTSRYT